MSNPEGPVVKLLGERSTGTNLLQSVLKAHFTIRLAPNSSGVSPDQEALLPPWYEGRWSSRRASREAIQDHNHWEEMPRNGGWKHAAATSRLLDTFLRPNNAILICLVRHPCDWVRSMHRNPFHNVGHVPRSFQQFLRAPWIAAARDELGARIVENPLQLYRAKLQSYGKLKQSWPQTVILRYEDIVLRTTETLMGTPLWNCRRMDEIKLPRDSARSFGRRRDGAEDYFNSAQAASYDRFSAEDRSFALKELDGSDVMNIYPS